MIKVIEPWDAKEKIREFFPEDFTATDTSCDSSIGDDKIHDFGELGSCVYLRNSLDFTPKEKFCALLFNSHRVRLENTLNQPAVFLVAEDPEALVLSHVTLGGKLKGGETAKITVNTQAEWNKRGGRAPLQRISVPPKTKIDTLVKSKTIYLTFFVKNKKKDSLWDVLQMNRAVPRDSRFIVQEGHLVQPVAMIRNLPDATENAIKPGDYYQVECKKPHVECCATFTDANMTVNDLLNAYHKQYNC